MARRIPEYAADETGAHLSGDLLGLAAALWKLGFASERSPLDASPRTTHLFIVHPLSGRSLPRLCSTHPPLEERIARLRAMTEQPASLESPYRRQNV
jgi:heat shock protein HtpX